jgi:hypothetical protein
VWLDRVQLIAGVGQVQVFTFRGSKIALSQDYPDKAAAGGALGD